MNLFIRAFIVFIRSFFKPKIVDILGHSELDFIVLPNDLDTNLHMNNGRYATIMDLGRLDLVLRNGLMKIMLKQKCVPVLSALQMRFRIQLQPFQSYRLDTQVICWDDKWVYMKQEFIINKGKKAGVTAAIGIVKGGFYDQNTRTTVPTQDLIKIMGRTSTSPEFPDYITEWINAEEKLKQLTKL